MSNTSHQVTEAEIKAHAEQYLLQIELALDTDGATMDWRHTTGFLLRQFLKLRSARAAEQ